MMASTLGLRKIVLFNWPWYALAVLGNVGAAVFISGTHSTSIRSVDIHSASICSAGWLTALSLIAVAVGNGWLLGSLLVSHWVYDRSPLVRGAWLDVLNKDTQSIGVLHAGQDEASRFVLEHFPNADVTIYDFFDPTENTEGSLQRARRWGGAPTATAVDPTRLPLKEATLDALVVVFAAHEIRRPERLAAFFAELHRVLRPKGIVIVVEHLRDGWNALAYGPGALHFLPRSTWSQAFAAAKLQVLQETRYTPFVTRFCLSRSS